MIGRTYVCQCKKSYHISQLFYSDRGMSVFLCIITNNKSQQGCETEGLMDTADVHWVVYKCSFCGQESTQSVTGGRPNPGSCPRKPKDRNGKMKPHSWVKSRTR